MKEKLNEIYQSLQERLKSPFLLTFILVWSIHNWDFLYGVLTFEDSLTYPQRIGFLKAYVKVYGTYHLFWFPLMWAFISLGLYLIASFISEGINLVYSKWIRTFLYWAIDRNKLKTEDDYNELEKRRIALQELVHDLKTRQEDAAIKLNAKEKEIQETLNVFRNKEQDSIKREEELKKGLTDKDNTILDLKSENQKNKELIMKHHEDQIYIENLKKTKKDLELFKLWVETKTTEVIQVWQNIDLAKTYKMYELNERFKAIFGKDTWHNHYIYSKGKSGEELFEIGNSATPSFKIENEIRFVIENINFQENNKLSFTKTEINTKQVLNVVLDISNKDILIGTENDTINVTYTRI